MIKVNKSVVDRVKRVMRGPSGRIRAHARIFFGRKTTPFEYTINDKKKISFCLALSLSTLPFSLSNSLLSLGFFNEPRNRRAGHRAGRRRNPPPPLATSDRRAFPEKIIPRGSLQLPLSLFPIGFPQNDP